MIKRFKVENFKEETGLRLSPLLFFNFKKSSVVDLNSRFDTNKLRNG